MFFTPALRTHAFVSPRLLDRGFERFVNQAYGEARRTVQLEQDEQRWTLRLDVPGVAREDLTVGIEGAVVRIETRAEAPRAFKAAYELPQDIDAAASEAKLENGVLTLTLAKREPASRITPLEVR